MKNNIQKELMNRLKRATRASMSDGYLSVSGIPMDKRPIDKSREATAVRMWAEAVWIANDHHATPFHFQMKAHEQVTAENKQGEENA